MVLLDQAKLADDGDFRGRVKVAAEQHALTVMGETQATRKSAWTKRQVYAAKFLGAADTFLSEVVLAVVADETITGATVDAALKTRVAAVWNQLAGVRGEDLL